MNASYRNIFVDNRSELCKLILFDKIKVKINDS